MMYAVVWIPDFELQAVLRTVDCPDTFPSAVVSESGQRSRVFQCNREASKHGVAPGQSVSQAIARCAKLRIYARSALAEKTASKALFSALYALTPLIETVTPDRFTLDLKGIRSESRKDKVQDTHRELSKLGFSTAIGVAAKLDWAHFAAKSKNGVIWVEPGRETVFFENVPIAAVVDSQSTLHTLQQWGIRNLAEFARLPESGIAKRLGVEGRKLWKSLHEPEVPILKLTSPPEDFSAGFDFEYEVDTLDALLFVINRLVGQLCLQLATLSLQCRVVVLELSLADNSRYRKAFRLPEPTSQANGILRVLKAHLENLHTSDAVRSLRIRVLPVSANPTQYQLFQQSIKDSWQLEATLQQLIGLLGTERVGSPRPADSHEADAFTMVDLPLTLEALPVNSGQVSKLIQTEGLKLQRFRPVIPVQVILRAGRPLAVQARGFSGSIRTVKGPWHSSGTWWDERVWKRSEWDIEMDQGLYRLLYTNRKWFLEGAYG